MVHEEGERFPAILQTFNMGNEPTPFDSKTESLRRPLVPPLENLSAGQPVKGDIQFDGIKRLGIEFKPFFLEEI